eukprot:TRINITY_DN2798_c1_g1_i1.p1 TRINITY_DN2798_c1_g1~~TRINITY_DN2798_c1_g1_i1.p1  ORF type:complete len:254 (-),score=95.87 TRINITY_DN2798_c1_g1_i1:43-804(-)
MDQDTPERAPATPQAAAAAAAAGGNDLTYKQQIQTNEHQIIQLEQELGKLRNNIAEREKELACHMLLSNLLDEIAISTTSLFHTLSDLVNILPPAWQFPEITCARMVTATHDFKTANFRETKWRQSADIYTTFTEKRKFGVLEVYYLEERPTMCPEFGPFMVEEQNLLNIVAERLGKFITQKLVEEKISRLMGMLMLCPCCKSVRDSGGAWKKLEDYLIEHTQLTFTSCMCPECANLMLASHHTFPISPNQML